MRHIGEILKEGLSFPVNFEGTPNIIETTKDVNGSEYKKGDMVAYVQKNPKGYDDYFVEVGEVIEIRDYESIGKKYLRDNYIEVIIKPKNRSKNSKISRVGNYVLKL